MKYGLLAFLFILSLELHSQPAGWVYLGEEIGFNFYYVKNSVVRGNRTFVIVAAKPVNVMYDESGVKIKYVSMNITFYESTTGVRALISNHVNFYEDDTFRKRNQAKRDLPVNFFRLLLKLYNEIR